MPPPRMSLPHPLSFSVLLPCLMLPPRNYSSLPNVDASSSRPGHNTASHEQAAPQTLHQRKQALVGRWPPSVITFYDVPELSNVAVPTTISQSTYLTSQKQTLAHSPMILPVTNSSLMHATTANNNRSLLNLVTFRSANIIPSPPYQRLQPKLNLHTIPSPVRLEHKINNDETHNTA